LSFFHYNYIDCGAPYTIKNGTINLERSGFTTLQSTATVSCDTGFDRSTDSITCLENGTWELASCIIKGYNFHIHFTCDVIDNLKNTHYFDFTTHFR
jgi:hypothetical protein